MNEDKEVTDTNIGNIDKDIKRCKELIKDKHKEWIGMTNQKAIGNVLKKYEELKVLEDDIQDKRIAYIDTLEFKDAFVSKQKIKDLLTEIQEEYNKIEEQFDCIWDKKSKDDYDRYKLQEFSTMQQQLGFFIGKLEELLEDK